MTGTQLSIVDKKEEVKHPEKPSDIESSSSKSKFKKYKFGFLYADEILKVAMESIKREDVFIEDVQYVVGASYNRFLVRGDFSLIKGVSTKKGYPIRVYDETSGEVVAVCWMPDKDIKDFSYIDEGMDLDGMYDVVVETKEDDINFQLMVTQLF